MHPRLAGDLAAFPALLESVRRLAVDVLDALDDRPAGRSPAPRPALPLPADGAGLAGALATFTDRWAPGFSGSAGPRYLGFVTGGATPAGLAGDWLTGVFDQNAGPGIGSSAGDLERETLGWLRELFGLPPGYGGTFVSGATMSNMVGLAIGREWLGERLGVDVSQQGAAALGETAVFSGAPHSSIYKALSMLGLGRGALRQLPLLPDREAVDVPALRAALADRAGRPAIVVANAGTVDTVDYDDLRAIAELRREYPFWLHVDAAFGAFAALSPAHAPLLDGLAEADSICVDLHKWLNVPYDSAVQFTRRTDLQLKVFSNAAAYLGPLTERPDFLHHTPENSRRLRALAAWFSLAAYGRDGHRDIVTRNIASAQRVGARLAELPGVRLLAPVRLNVVCLALPGDQAEAARAVAESGEAFVTPTVYAGTPALRLAFCNWRTSEADEDRIVAAVRRALP
ncbi:pyridoxal phosphate-dependent decarboxylase family protein [Couchioplanes azureus]|uniref:pyridoxal phosphate-dependent decarboxylase family protein n=1 Tax=Couchioplanes caeruleus TaxID=56438 RepID=UPI0016702B43|nr:pyridoxal-dependent decarboxylase [Couchioplanes caeruleus]GGQ81841.1 aspartate aminotransferase family protein [Couchioplanes caeruleus subsp. azureus]